MLMGRCGKRSGVSVRRVNTILYLQFETCPRVNITLQWLCIIIEVLAS